MAGSDRVSGHPQGSMPPLAVSRATQEKLDKLKLTAGQLQMIDLLADIAVQRLLKEKSDQEQS